MAKTPPSREVLNEQLDRLRKEKRDLERLLRPESLARMRKRVRDLGDLIEDVAERRDRTTVARRKPQRAGRPVETLDRRQMAGEENIGRVERALASGPMFQSDLTRAVERDLSRALGRPAKGVSGTVTHALRALEEDGRVVPTGRTNERGSRELRLLKRRRSTTMTPGS